jgi:hypothetical protein
MTYKKYFFLISIYCFMSTQVLALNQMDINIIKLNLKKFFSIKQIEQFCKFEDPGLDIDSMVGNYFFFKKNKN